MTRQAIEETFERYRPLIPQWNDFIDTLNTPLPTCFWTNTLRTDHQTLEKWFETINLPVTQLPWWPQGFKYTEETARAFGTLFPFVAGLCHIQEEVSMMPPLVLDAQPGDRVLDMCAAPGGKTAQIAVQMNNMGTIIANDRSYQRLRAMRGIIDRLGLVNITMTVWDASSLQRDLGTFDRILADVPCSCEGTSRKNHAIIEQGPHREYEALSKVQVGILRKAWRMIKPGGTIVYSTCTYAPEENEMVIQRAFDEDGWDNLEILPIDLPGVHHASGLTEWEGQTFHPSMVHAMRLYPHHNNTGGFFIAKLRKVEDA